MHIVVDLIEIWVAALSLAFAALLFASASIHDGGLEDKIMSAFPIVIVGAAVVVSVLIGVGIVGTW